MSLNAFEDDTCDGDDYSELRLITDECFLYEDMKYVKMECDGDSAKYSGTLSIADRYTLNHVHSISDLLFEYRN